MSNPCYRQLAAVTTASLAALAAAPAARAQGPLPTKGSGTVVLRNGERVTLTATLGERGH